MFEVPMTCEGRKNGGGGCRHDTALYIVLALCCSHLIIRSIAGSARGHVSDV